MACARVRVLCGPWAWRVRMLLEYVLANARVRVPYSHGRVKRRGRKQEIGVGVVGAGPGRTPFDSVYLLGVIAQVAHARTARHRPDFCCVVVGARREQLARRVPLDRVDLVAVAGEAFEVVGLVEFTDINLLVSRARGEAVLVAPVHVEGRLLVEGKLRQGGRARERARERPRPARREGSQGLPDFKHSSRALHRGERTRGGGRACVRGGGPDLLLDVAGLRVPNNGRLVHAAAEEVAPR